MSVIDRCLQTSIAETISIWSQVVCIYWMMKPISTCHSHEIKYIQRAGERREELWKNEHRRRRKLGGERKSLCHEQNPNSSMISTDRLKYKVL